MNRQWLYNALLAVTFATQATAIAILIFMLSRGDHDMKLLALGAAISQTSALMATASTMLVGKDFGNRTVHDPADLPSGGVQTETNTTTIAAPPVAPAVAEAITPATAPTPQQ